MADDIELELIVDPELAADGEKVELSWTLKKPAPAGLEATLERRPPSAPIVASLPKGKREETVSFSGGDEVTWTIFVRATGAPAGAPALFQNQVTVSKAPATPSWLTANHTFRNGSAIDFGGRSTPGTQFVSFGQPFADGKPANQTLAQKLVEAEIRVFRQYASSERALLATRTGDMEGADFQADYYDFLGICFTHIGFRNGQGKHASGSALDMNFDTNAYFPSRHAPGDYGGEPHKLVPAAQHKLQIWDPAWEACDVATEFWFGPGQINLPTIVPTIDNKRLLAANYDLHARVSFALKNYFQITMKPAFPTPQSQRTPEIIEQWLKLDRKGANLTPEEKAEKRRLTDIVSIPGGSVRSTLVGPALSATAPAGNHPACRHRTFDEFVAELRRFAARGQVPHAFLLFDPGDTDATPRRQQLKKFHDRAPQLHDQCRPGMVIGSCGFENGRVTMPSGSRDPCIGFLDIRKEIVLAIATRLQGGQCVRWGGCNFGGEDGDRQHFDLGSNVPP